MNKINKLIKVADHLDKLGFYFEANQIDFLIKKIASRIGTENTKTPQDLLIHLNETILRLDELKKLINLDDVDVVDFSEEKREEEEEEVTVLEFNSEKASFVFNRLSDLLIELIIPTAKTIFNKYPRTLLQEVVEESSLIHETFILPWAKTTQDIKYFIRKEPFTDVENIIIMGEIESTHNMFKDFYDRVSDMVVEIDQTPSRGVRIPFEEEGSEVTKVELTQPS